MKLLWHTLKWDLIRQSRYNIVSIILVLTVLYAGVLWLKPFGDSLLVLIFFIFSDPTILGMMFVGSLVLFEKSEGTLLALEVSPQKKWHYLLSKGLSLTLLSTLSALVLALVGRGMEINILYLILGVGLTSLMFVFIGFVVVMHSTSFNEFMIKAVFSFFPMVLPLLNLLEVTNSYWLYLIPTQATLILIQGSFEGVAHGEIAYAIIYLTFCTVLAFCLALRQFDVSKKT